MAHICKYTVERNIYIYVYIYSDYISIQYICSKVLVFVIEHDSI